MEPGAGDCATTCPGKPPFVESTRWTLRPACFARAVAALMLSPVSVGIVTVLGAVPTWKIAELPAGTVVLVGGGVVTSVGPPGLRLTWPKGSGGVLASAASMKSFQTGAAMSAP